MAESAGADTWLNTFRS